LLVEIYKNEDLIMRVTNLKIDIAENGFVVYEQTIEHGVFGKQWAFESAKTLADFVSDWGHGNTKVKSSHEGEIKSA
jgi:hypothetical protein